MALIGLRALRDAPIVRLVNTVVTGVLRSPIHRVLSGAVDVIRYTGRRSGRRYSTPTQYVQHGDDVLILAGRSDDKTWWRNFRTDRDLEVLIRGEWRPMTGRAVVGADDPDAVSPLLDAYLERFPKAAGSLGPDRETRLRRAVVVRCRPR